MPVVTRCKEFSSDFFGARKKGNFYKATYKNNVLYIQTNKLPTRFDNNSNEITIQCDKALKRVFCETKKCISEKSNMENFFPYDHENTIFISSIDESVRIYNENGERIETIKDESIMRHIITLKGYIVQENIMFWKWHVVQCQESNKIFDRDFELFFDALTLKNCE
jgi:hypothetical protein